MGKQEAVNAHQQQQQQQQHQQHQHHHAITAQHNTITIMDDGNPFEQQQAPITHVQIQQPQEMFATAISVPMVSTISDMPPKISTPSILSNRIEPPQHQHQHQHQHQPPPPPPPPPPP